MLFRGLPPASAHRGGAGPLSSLRVSRVGPACLGGQCVVRPCGSSRCEDTVARPLVDGDDTQGVGPADMKPSLGDIGPGARRSRYRCERQPKRAIVHTGIPQRPPRGARPARAHWNPNLATEDSVRRWKTARIRVQNKKSHDIAFHGTVLLPGQNARWIFVVYKRASY